MPRTTIRSEDITDLEVKTADVAVGGITTAKMATDPTNASNLTSGSVPTGTVRECRYFWNSCKSG